MVTRVEQPPPSVLLEEWSTVELDGFRLSVVVLDHADRMKPEHVGKDK